ncbi:ABC transporter G family member 28 [Chlorella vulgaris]
MHASVAVLCKAWLDPGARSVFWPRSTHTRAACPRAASSSNMAAVTLSLRLLTASLSSRGKSATAAITSAVTAGRSTGSALLRGSKGCGRLVTSRPALSLHASAIVCTAAGDGVMEVQLKVGGMVCDGCSSRVEEMLQTMAGVKKAHVDLEKGVATVQAHGYRFISFDRGIQVWFATSQSTAVTSQVIDSTTRNSGRHLAAGGGIGCWTPMGAWRRHATPLLLVLVLLSAGTSTCQGRMLDGRWDWPWPWHPNSTHDGGKDERNQEWVRTLDVLWDRSKDKIGFCLGGSQLKAQRLMGLSFPWPLPVSAPSSGSLCSNRTRIDLHLCGPEELEHYYQYMLLTDNQEKNRVASVVPQEPVACCEGYFCPAQLSCMVPCPLGAFCPRAWPAPPPDAYKSSAGKQAQWCAPYGYKERPELGCGGADKWRIIPGSAFPIARWAAGSGSIYCDGGQYCPNTTTSLGCPRGHFCRQGEWEPARCPPGATCPPNTEVFEANYTGVTVDALLFGLLWLAWLCSQQYNRVLLQLSQRERLKITWGAAPQIRVVQQAVQRGRTPSPVHANTRRRPGQLAAGAARLPLGALGMGADSAEGPSSGSGLGRPGLLGVLAGRSPRRSLAGRSGSKAGQVWATFRGPGEGEADAAGYEALLGEGGEEEQRPLGEDVEMSPTRRGGGLSSRGLDLAAEPGSCPLPAAPGLAQGVTGGRTRAAAHARMASADVNEEELTPRHLHTRLVAQHRQSLLASPLSSMHGGTGLHRGQALHVQFRELGLRLRGCGQKMVLQGVTGELPAGRVTAIMGPSGAGKSSLLNVLSGKAQAYGVQTGTVLINGRADKLERYKDVLGFVPQDDIMHATLTVQENLLFSARFRLPASCRREQHLLFVERAIAVLQLEDVRDCQIGDEHRRGVSGGQKRRCSVGLELVADPSLLFLDEPTSGLDSTASKALVAALQAVARSNVTCAAVIHQPSWQCLQLFDFLLLLGKGGRTVYCGVMASAQSYFEGLGYELPDHQNPADAFLDIISGELLPPGRDQASPTELFDAWDDHCGQPRKSLPPSSAPGSEAGSTAGRQVPPQAALLGGMDGSGGGPGAGSDLPIEGDAVELLGDEEERRSWARRFREAALFAGASVMASTSSAWAAVKQDLPGLNASQLGGRLFRRQKAGADGDAGQRGSRAVPYRQPPGFLPQLWWCLCRAVLQRSREPLALATDYTIFALTGMTLGLISDRGRETIMHFAVGITYSVVALGLLSTVGALTTFSKDRVVFYREASSGLNRFAHFLALDTFGHCGTVLRSAVYFVMYYSFAAPRAVIWQMLMVMEPSAAQLSAAVLALINTLIARQGHPGALLRLAQSFSFARWGLEGYVIAESNRLTGAWLLARCADLEALTYDTRHFGRCLLALFGLGLLFRGAALLAMTNLHRDKQR